MKIKVGDTVVVTTGRDRLSKDKKGNIVPTTAKVLKVYPKTNKVLVEGVNKVKKHQKPTQQNQSGSIVEMEAPIHVSNVMLLDPKDNVPTRVGYTVIDGKGKDKDGQPKKIKVRITKKSNTILDN